MRRPRLAGAVLVAMVTTAMICPAAAGEDDHDRARAALERGEVMPLRAILDKIGRDYPGTVIEVELERERDRWIYEIRVLRDGGALVKLEVDARDGAVLGVKGRESPRANTDGRR